MKKQFQKAVTVIGSAVLMGSVMVSNALALDFATNPVTLNTSDVDEIMVVIIGGLATLWGFRKIIKTLNRS